jgi:hypothetical protein
VSLDDGPFVRRERAGLVDERDRHAHLSDVVKERRKLRPLSRDRIEPQLVADCIGDSLVAHRARAYAIDRRRCLKVADPSANNVTIAAWARSPELASRRGSLVRGIVERTRT